MAPSVFNWYEPTYRAPGNLTNAGFNSPEYALTNGATESKRVNAFHQLIFEYWHDENNRRRTTIGLGAGNPLIQLYNRKFEETRDRHSAATAVIEEIDLLLASGNMKRSQGGLQQ